MKRLMKEDFGLRCLVFIACIPSGGALLAKVFGIASLQSVTVYIFLPCILFLIIIWVFPGITNRSYLHNAITIGFWGGLAGTLAYDAVRVPFLVLLGQRVFAPISVYGVWLAEAGISSRLTEVLGWSYHFSNGITFGIMYALFMRRRHWLWAILWAFILETIALASPFSQIFNLTGNYSTIGIAYLGHVAYGLPLGWLVSRWPVKENESESSRLQFVIPLIGAVLAIIIVLSPLIRPSWIGRDERAMANTLLVEGNRLNPDWVRIEKGDRVTFRNSNEGKSTVIGKSTAEEIQLFPGEATTISFQSSGIYQYFVETDGRTHSSFIIVEPVENLD